MFVKVREMIVRMGEMKREIVVRMREMERNGCKSELPISITVAVRIRINRAEVK